MAEQIVARSKNVVDAGIIALDADNLAQIQKGYYKKPEFYGDMSMSSNNFGSFKEAVGTAANYFSFAQNLLTVAARSSEDDGFYITDAEYNEIKKLSESISSYGNTPYQTIVDFLIILCNIDNMEDMTKIATVLEIDELNNSAILQKPFEILAIRTIYKIAFMANALDALIKLFSKYSQPPGSNQGADNLESVMSAVGTILGIGQSISRLTNMNSSENAIGHFMTELLTGKRVPMTVIANNPMKSSPSYVGQSLFGESPIPLSNVDIKEMHNKKIGVFKKPSNGAGLSSFGMMNFNSMSGMMNIVDFAAKSLFGSTNITPGSFKEDKLLETVSKLQAATGVTLTETFNVSHCDTALPLQISMSQIHSGLDQNPFGIASFQEGWQLANHISNYMQNNNPQFLNVIKGIS